MKMLISFFFGWESEGDEEKENVVNSISTFFSGLGESARLSFWRWCQSRVAKRTKNDYNFVVCGLPRRPIYCYIIYRILWGCRRWKSRRSLQFFFGCHTIRHKVRMSSEQWKYTIQKCQRTGNWVVAQHFIDFWARLSKCLEALARSTEACSSCLIAQWSWN